MISTITANPSLDVTIALDELRVGEIHRTQPASSEAGGKGVNVARGLVRSGYDAEAIVLCGSSESPSFFDSLRASRVKSTVVDTGQPARSNISVIESSGRTTKLNEPGCRVGHDDVERLLDAAEKAARTSSWVVAAGSLAPGMDDDFYAVLARRLAGSSARVAIDASGPALASVLASPGLVLKPNQEELAAVWQSPIQSIDQAIDAAEEIVAASGSTILLSLGPDGAVAVAPDRTVRGIAPAEDVRNTVGAGDSMLAGFIAGYEASNGSTVEALRSGLAWGRAAVRSEGTGFRAVGGDDYRAVRIEGERT